MGSGGKACALVLGGIASAAAACTTIAGVDSKEIDVCFDGCDGGVPATSSSSGGSGTPGPGGPNGSDAGAPGPLDDGGCNCPAGMQRMNGVCVMSSSPMTYPRCDAPLQLPSCEIAIELDLCDTVPRFRFDPGCSGVSGGQERPALFVRLGKSPTGRFETRTRGPYIQAVTSAACDRGVAPCGRNANPNTVFRSSDAPNNTTFAFGKRDGAGCDKLQMTVEFN